MHPIKILIPLIYSSDLKEYPVDTSQSKMGFSKVLTVNAYLNATFTALVENLGTSAVVLVVVFYLQYCIELLLILLIFSWVYLYYKSESIKCSW